MGVFFKTCPEQNGDIDDLCVLPFDFWISGKFLVERRKKIFLAGTSNECIMSSTWATENKKLRMKLIMKKGNPRHNFCKNTTICTNIKVLCVGVLKKIKPSL